MKLLDIKMLVAVTELHTYGVSCKSESMEKVPIS